MGGGGEIMILKRLEGKEDVNMFGKLKIKYFQH